MAKRSGVSPRVQHYAQHASAFDFFNTLTHPELLYFLEARLPAHRNVVDTDRPGLECGWVMPERGGPGGHESPVERLAVMYHRLGAYCQARARLPLTLLTQLTRFVAEHIEAHMPKAWRWRARRVRVINGTTLTMDDTPANQAAYPQQRNQKPGLGFPICRLVAAFDLADGALTRCSNNTARGGARPIFAAVSAWARATIGSP